VSDSAAECTSGQYRNIHQLAEKLASPNKKSPVDTLDRLLQGIIGGEFDGHMQIGGEDFSSKELLSAVQRLGILSVNPGNEGIQICRGELAAWRYADFPSGIAKGDPRRIPQAYSFRDAYIDRICLDQTFVQTWWDQRLGARTAQPQARSALVKRSAPKLDRAHRALDALWPDGGEEKVEEKQRQKRIETWCRDKNELPPPALRTISRAMKERRAAK
jgi:hypothetical protein